GGAFGGDDDGLDDLPAVRVGDADDRRLGHVRGAHQHLLHLDGGDVVAGRDDHVVGAGPVPEVAVGVAHVGVAGDVPAAAHVDRLPLVVEVAAADRAAHREPAGGAVGHRPAVVAEHLCGEPGDGAAGGAGADVLVGGGDEDVQHLGG